MDRGRIRIGEEKNISYSRPKNSSPEGNYLHESVPQLVPPYGVVSYHVHVQTSKLTRQEKIAELKGKRQQAESSMTNKTSEHENNKQIIREMEETGRVLTCKQW